MPSVLSKSKAFADLLPKCPPSTDRHLFPTWITQFRRYAHGIGVKDHIFDGVPKPKRLRLGKKYLKEYETSLREWEEKNNEAFLAITMSLAGQHEDVFQDTDFDPFKIMEKLQKKFGFSNDGTAGAADFFLLNEFLSKKLDVGNSIKDLPANLTKFITDLNNLADCANNNSPTVVIADHLKFLQLSKNCGPLTSFIQTSIIHMKEKTYSALVDILNGVMRLPLDELEALTRTPSVSPGSNGHAPVQNGENHNANAFIRRPKWNNNRGYKPRHYVKHNSRKFVPKFNRDRNQNYKRKFKNNYQSNHPGDRQFRKGFKRHGNVICDFCGQEGHVADDCRRRPSQDDVHPPRWANVCGHRACSMIQDSPFVLLDCGASDSHIHIKDFLDEFDPNAESVEIASACGKVVPTKGIGSMGNVKFYYTPGLRVNLLSLSQLIDLGYKAEVNRDHISLKYLDIVDIRAIKSEGVYKIDLFNLKEQLNKIDIFRRDNQMKMAYSARNLGGYKDFKQFHYLTHLNRKSFNRLVQLKAVHGIKPDKSGTASDEKCIHCLKAKLRRKSYRKKRIIDKDLPVLCNIITDVKGPLTPEARDSSRYVVSFIDQKTRYKWVYCIKTKDEVAEAFREFCKENIVPLLRDAPKTTKIYFKTVFSDGGHEYMGRFTQVCEEMGYRQQMVPRSTPELNGIAENYWRTLFSLVRAYLDAAKHIPLFDWIDTVKYANEVLNSTLLVSIDDEIKTSYEWLHHEIPDLTRFHIFGERAIVHLPKELRDNTSLGEHAVEAWFIGFDPNHIHSGRYLQKLHHGYKVIVQDYDNVQYLGLDGDASAGEATPNNQLLTIEGLDPVNVEENEAESVVDQAEPIPVAPKQKRVRKLYTKVRQSMRIKERLLHRAAMVAMKDDKSLSLKDVLESDKPFERIQYLDALIAEIRSIEGRDVWVLTDVIDGKKLLKSKWIFTTKHDARGREVRKKARLVVIGCLAVEGEDYTLTYAPVTKMPSLRVFLSIVCQFDLYMYQLDVDTAFLYADLEEEIYLEIPPMFTYYHRDKSIMHKCLRLKKALYGLPQAPRAWFKTIDKFFRECGYTPLVHEPCIYIKVCRNNKIALMTLYVDDMIIAHNNWDELMHLVDQIEKRFNIKKIGVPQKMLGINIDYRKRDGELVISTKSKILELVKEFNIADTRPTPMQENLKFKLAKESDINEEEKTTYRSLLGKLMFIMVATRPDISYAVSALARFMTNPTRAQHEAALDVVRYLNGTLDLTVIFKRRHMDDYDLTAYSDSDWGGNLDNRRSRSGGLILLGGSPIFWSSVIQTLVALSSAEAEINALKDIVKNVLWIRGILKDTTLIPQVIANPTIIFEDNSAVLEIVINPEVSKRNRHYDMSYHFIRENVEEFKNVLIRWIGTDSNLADLFTKALGEHKFAYFRSFILRWWKK